MCVYSNMIDAGRQVNPTQWTPDTWSQFQQILQAIRELDAKLGQTDCEDPAKQAWMREVEDRLDSLELKTKTPPVDPGREGE